MFAASNQAPQNLAIHFFCLFHIIISIYFFLSAPEAMKKGSGEGRGKIQREQRSILTR